MTTWSLAAAIIGGGIGALLGLQLDWPRQRPRRPPRLRTECLHERRAPYTPRKMFHVEDESAYASVCMACGQALRLKPTHH
jgi:hypothetical protein